MSSPSIFDIEGTARVSLREIINDYGAAALDDERLIASLLTDLLAGQPREATLVRAAARVRAASLLRAHAANRMPPHAAIEDVAARLGHEALIEPNAARWIITEYAIAVGITTGGPTTSDSATPTTSDPATPTTSDPATPVATTPPHSPAAPTGSVAPTRMDTAAPPPVAAPAPAPAPPAPISTPPAPTSAPAPTSVPAGRSTGSSWLALGLAAGLPVVLAIVVGAAFSGNIGASSYSGWLQGTWLFVLLPLTVTLIVVTAVTRGDARAWRATAYVALGVYAATTILPWWAEPGSVLEHPFNWLGLGGLPFVRYNDGGVPLMWLLVHIVALTVLTHAVMKRLGTVEKTGLLTALLPVGLLLVNLAYTGYFIINAARRTYADNTGGLIGLLVLINGACAVAILLSRVPKIGGRG